ncbi:hypothetical protein [Otariodibacter oris]|uniref:Phage shock protein B n=1 Tax=Otariodibacter oris TaxID=1032623 RepID=A0A420XII1_9PAST|nr:hypothetical protein [Otariodibacter oris]QGM80674.1 hypothetical protein A6A10_04280 [Otariodibacter oris]RKR77165.1 hypothetical protein DES31_0490 [Otariodibacter oris]
MIDDKLFQMLISFVVMPVLGFSIKIVVDKINRNEASIQELKREVEDKYQSKELAREVNRSLQERLDMILDQMREINAKLDKKADKQ